MTFGYILHLFICTKMWLTLDPPNNENQASLKIFEKLKMLGTENHLGKRLIIEMTIPGVFHIKI